jgi:hypothetical protein
MTNVVQLQQVRKQELDYLCSKCGAERGCDCNAPAIKRAAVALATNPEKSDRAIAAEIGVSHPTVAKARQEAEATGKLLPVDRRIGADGKARTRKPKVAQIQIDKLRAVNSRLFAESCSVIDELKTKNKVLAAECTKLKAENERLKAENATLKGDIATLKVVAKEATATAVKLTGGTVK